MKRTFFQPLAVLKLAVKHHNNRDIQNIQEASVEDFFFNIHTDPIKISLVFFLSEFLSKLLREPNKDATLFDFIRESLLLLESKKMKISNFHLVFLLKLSHFLGFYPNFDSYAPNSLFDMTEGTYVASRFGHHNCLSREDSRFVLFLGKMNYRNMHLVKFDRQDRNRILEQILNYYQIHASLTNEFKTLDILKELY